MFKPGNLTEFQAWCSINCWWKRTQWAFFCVNCIRGPIF